MFLFIIYAVGAAMTAWYVFGTKYLTVPDAVRSYELYRQLRVENYWALHDAVLANNHQYILQLSCLFTTYIPAKISLIIPIDPELFYKIYILVFLPLLPVVVYALARKFVGMMGAALVGLFIIGWVSFLTGASTARAGIALIFYALALLLAFSPSINRYLRYSGLVLVGICIPLAHYTSAFLAIAMVGGMVALSFMFWESGWRYRKPFIIFLIPIVVMTLVWCFPISKISLVYITDSTLGAVSSGLTTWVPDTAAKTAIGVISPGHNFVWFDYALLVLGWLTILGIAWGIFRAFRDKVFPLELRIIGVLSFITCAFFFLLSPLARIYGVERVYFQSLVALGIFFIFGIYQLAKKFSIPGWVVGLPLVVIYVAMMKAYELTHSIVEAL